MAAAGRVSFYGTVLGQVCREKGFLDYMALCTGDIGYGDSREHGRIPLVGEFGYEAVVDLKGSFARIRNSVV